jgi:hypothetical protein
VTNEAETRLLEAFRVYQETRAVLEKKGLIEMASFADDFRAEAKAKPGEVVRRVANGWSFCLSYGAVDPLHAADAAADANLRMEHAGRDVTNEVMERLKTTEISEEAKEALKGEWMFSAKLWPPGRGSTEADWAYLGKMLFAMGAPKKAPPTIENAPNDTHYWVWKDS